MTIKYVQGLRRDADSVIANIEYPSDPIPIEPNLERSPSAVSSDIESSAPSENSEANLELATLEGRKYKYDCPVDVNDGDRGTGVRILSIRRPHMASFWGVNIAHRASVFMWFSAVPLYSTIEESLDISPEAIWTSYICAICGAIVGRIIAGLACGKYGARLTSAALIIFSTFPTTLQGAVTNSTTFCIARFFAAFGGGVFVASVCWMDDMFTKDLSARINGFSGGLGAATGLCQGFLGVMVFPLITKLTGSKELGWRLSFSVVSLGCLIVGIGLIFLTDDTPRGNYSKLKRTGEISPTPLLEAFKLAINNKNIWILCIQYGCNFGVELAINNALISYFKEDYGLSNTTSIVLASVFPAANQFARMGGGRLSDKAYLRNGMKGRLQCQFIFLLVAGITFVFFSFTTVLWVSLSCLCIMAVLLLFSQSATYGIVPYINTSSNQAVAGVVGASGTLGGILVALVFRNLPTYREAFCVTGYLIIFSAVLTVLIDIPGHGSLFSKTEDTRGKAMKSTTTKETAENASIRTSSACAEELVDSMCFVESSQPGSKEDDFPYEISVNMKKKVRRKSHQPLIGKARSDSVLETSKVKASEDVEYEL